MNSTAIIESASKIRSLPGLSLFSPPAPVQVSEQDREGFARSQSIARQAVSVVSGLVREGWTEMQAADLLNTYLRDSGVRSFFHQAFVWFGERTRFSGVSRYRDYAPGRRVIRSGEVFILDVAPVFQGYVCDIGTTDVLGENPALDRAQSFLGELRAEIPILFQTLAHGGEICEQVATRIRAKGYDVIHEKYPFSVLGHRVHKGVLESGSWSWLGFGWQSYWEFLSRGLFGQLLNKHYRGSLDGLWAIEPHIGDPSGFGAKFEEILWVQDGVARWLQP